MNPQALALIFFSSFFISNSPTTVHQFCVFPCDDPFQQAREQNMPPPRSDPPPNPNTPIFLNSTDQPSKRDDTLSLLSLPLKRGPYDFLNSRASSLLSKRDDLLSPLYAIDNAAGPLSSRTAYVRIYIFFLCQNNHYKLLNKS